MKSTVRKLDRSLKRLYGLSNHPNAEDFLISKLTESMAQALIPLQKGALILQLQRTPHRELQLGIYLSPALHHELSRFNRWTRPWTPSQVSAFSVAIEEVSHFHLLNFHLERGKAVRQIELETQGEIDKFLLLYFATYRTGAPERHFCETFERLFVNYSFHPLLKGEQRERYEEANSLAGRFIQKKRHEIQQCLFRCEKFKPIREFYRLDYPDKLRWICR